MNQQIAFEAQQQARENELLLFQTLEKIYKYKITRDPDFPLYTSSIYFKYHDLVFAAIRKAIENVHMKGIEYVGNRLKQEVYMTETDIATIKVQAEFSTDLFFKALAKQSETVANSNNNMLKGAAEQETEEEQGDAGEEAVIDYDTNLNPIDQQTGFLAIIKRVIISAMTISFSKSVLSKASQLPAGFSNTGNSIYSHKVRWICQFTERTCMVCANLHGRIFFVNDVNVPLPGTLGTFGSHPNCRCYFELVT